MALQRNIFDQQIEAAHRRLESLQQYAGGTSPEQAAVSPEVELRANQALEELSNALEELHVAGEELRQQNDELAAARQAAEAERQRYQELFEFAPDGYLVTDPEGVIQEANRAAAAMLGVRQDFLVGKPLLVFVADAQAGHVVFHTRLTQLQTARTDKLEDWEIWLQPREGEPFPVQATMGRVCDASGRLTGLRWLLRDITERVRTEAVRLQAEQARLDSETKLKALIDNTADTIWSIDTDYRITSANATFRDGLARFIGREIQNGESVFTGVSQAIADEWKPLYARALGGETFAQVSIAHGGFRGSVYRETFFNPIRAQDGKVIGVACFSRDITERKYTEEALRQSEEKYRNIFENALVAIYQTSPEGRFINANAAFAQMTGYASPEELMTSITHIGEQLYVNREERLELAQLLAEHDKVDGFEIQLKRKDGQTFWVLSSPRVVRDGEGNILCYEGALIDITERKRAEEALRQAEENYRAIFENAVEGIYQSSLPGRFTNVNSAMARILGYASPDQVVTRITSIRDQFYADPGRRTTALQQLEQKGKIENYESECLRKDGSRIWISENARAVRDTNGTILYYEGFIQDITERKRAEDALRTSLAEKVVLLREAHHRVRNNLAVIIGLLRLQKDTVTDPAAVAQLHELAGRIHSMALVHERLYHSDDLSRINLGLYLETLATHLRDSLDPSGGVHLSVAAAPSTAVEIGLDTAVPCGLVVNELITNAFKHAFPGGQPRPGELDCAIAVSSRMAQDNDMCTLTVADNGIGLPASLDWATASTLGLQLVHLLADQIEGRVEVDTRSGVTWTLTFPVKRG